MKVEFHNIWKKDKTVALPTAAIDFQFKYIVFIFIIFGISIVWDKRYAD